MKVLVTGGAGFIGSHTVEELLEMGAKVRVLDNLSMGMRSNLPTHKNLDLQVGDIRNPNDVAMAMQGMTHVMHLAAQVSVQASVDDPPTSCSHNIQGFVNVLYAARRQDVKRFVYASSAAVYGIPERVPLSESASIKPISPYGLEKHVNEQYGTLFQSLYGFPTLGLRYFNVFGPRQDPKSPYAGVISKFIERINGDQPLMVFGDGLQTRDFIFVKDIVRANCAALAGEVAGACNVGTGQSWTLLQVIDALSACVQKPLMVQHLPERGGDIRHSAAQVGRIQEQLGFSSQTSLEAGLKELLSYLCPTQA